MGGINDLENLNFLGIRRLFLMDGNKLTDIFHSDDFFSAHPGKTMIKFHSKMSN
jgi:hypothetical protein